MFSFVSESILRADLLEQIPHIAAQAVESSSRVSALKNVVGEYLIPLVVRNLGYSDNAVDKAAHATLIHLVEQGFISKQQAEIQVCPSILALSKVTTAADVQTQTGAIKVRIVHCFLYMLDIVLFLLPLCNCFVKDMGSEMFIYLLSHYLVFHVEVTISFKFLCIVTTRKKAVHIS